MKKIQIPEKYSDAMEKQQAAAIVGAVLAVVTTGALQLFQLVTEAAAPDTTESTDTDS
jgi:hypothetical protein